MRLPFAFPSAKRCLLLLSGIIALHFLLPLCLPTYITIAQHLQFQCYLMKVILLLQNMIPDDPLKKILCLK